MIINSNLRSIKSNSNLNYPIDRGNAPKLNDTIRKEIATHTSFVKEASDYLSDKLIDIGDWWSEKKSINNEISKKALEDSETLLEMLKNTTGKIAYGAMNGVAKVSNATTSVLDVAESYSNDIKNNRNNLPETLNAIVKGTSQGIIGGVVTTGVISAVGLGAGIVGLPIVVGGVTGGLAAYGTGKIYDYFSSF